MPTSFRPKSPLPLILGLLHVIIDQVILCKPILKSLLV